MTERFGLEEAGGKKSASRILMLLVFVTLTVLAAALVWIGTGQDCITVTELERLAALQLEELPELGCQVRHSWEELGQFYGAIAFPLVVLGGGAYGVNGMRTAGEAIASRRAPTQEG